jgi:molybdopterin converting factor small subunit
LAKSQPKIKIRVEIRPWLSDRIGDKPGTVVLEEEVESGTTVTALLTRLVKKHRGLGEVLFTTMKQELDNQVCVVVNGKLLQPGELSKSLQDGNTVTLLPVIDGG